MKEPNYNEILNSRIEYYGKTPLAYESSAEEFAKQKIDYKKIFGDSGSLLERYIKHVINHEGSSFIDKIHSHSDDIHFTDEEIQILKTLSK